MLITKEVETKWSVSNKDWYISKGYKFTKMKDDLIVKVEDLKIDSHVHVDVLCDYCEITVVSKEYRNTFINKEYIDKDCCKQCAGLKEKEINNILYSDENFNKKRQEKRKATSLVKYGFESASQSQIVKDKTKETNLLKYGVESHNQVPEVKLKKQETCMQNYGVLHPLQSKEIKIKFENTNLNKFGFIYPMQNNEVKQRAIETNLIKYGSKNPMGNVDVKNKFNNTIEEKYGVSNISQLQEIKDKKIQTTLEHYGVNHHMQDKEIQSKAFIKRNKTVYLNGQIPCSLQQLYLNNIILGDINYPVSHILLDIKLDDNIYVEYDGGGHNLNVKMNQISQVEFDRKEIKRYLFLKNLGWKMIRIISIKDRMPSYDIILKMISEAREYLNTGHSWIKYDIDNSEVITSQYKKYYNFGHLIKINKRYMLEKDVVV